MTTGDEAPRPGNGGAAVPRMPDEGPWVLVVEDDPKFGELVVRALGRAGLRAVLTASGDAALRVIGSPIAVSAVVLDVMIPHPDGIEICRHLRRQGWTVPVIAISARSSARDCDRMDAAGADAFLAKPFALVDLVELVGTMLARQATL